jgi:succinyl-diaminopimelate desuccinylase
VDGVMIGYPGSDHLVTGGRGVLRAQLHARGMASHSGGRRATANAITKAAALVSSLVGAQLPAGAEPAFPLPPWLTVTEISGGTGYSAVPDLCTLRVDVRLMPRRGSAARRVALRPVNRRWVPRPPPGLVGWHGGRRAPRIRGTVIGRRWSPGPDARR